MRCSHINSPMEETIRGALAEQCTDGTVVLQLLSPYGCDKKSSTLDIMILNALALTQWPSEAEVPTAKMVAFRTTRETVHF